MRRFYLQDAVSIRDGNNAVFREAIQSAGREKTRASDDPAGPFTDQGGHIMIVPRDAHEHTLQDVVWQRQQ